MVAPPSPSSLPDAGAAPCSGLPACVRLVRMLRRLMRPVDARFDQMRREIGYAQQMAARAYEAALRWPEQLAEVRADPGYELAFTEAEPLVSIRIATYNRAELLC